MIDLIKQCLLPLNEPSKIQDDLRCAAVLVPLIFDKDSQQWHVLFTVRAEHLKHHPGQISFPGGSFEIEDKDLSYTALRETNEEIGIDPAHVQLLGLLPQQKTTSQYYIRPFVGLVAPEHQITIDANEVAEVFTAPLSLLTDSSNQQKVIEEINGTEYSFYVIRYKNYNIWGATARILVNLSRRLNVAQPSN